MPRWESDAQGRLERAALDLFESQGFEQTSVAQIANAAGLKERSFYRYFPDKREVLFAGDGLEAHLVAQVEAAEADLPPFEALLTALETTGKVLPRGEFVLRRTRVVAASPALAERELTKLADIATVLAQALERRGVEAGLARFIVEVVLAVHRRATSRWLADPDASLSDLITRTAAELREAIAPTPTTARRNG